MPAKRDKVVVAMSGGVDSSVAACVLIEQGYEVVGLFMRTGVQAPEEAAPGVACSAGEGDKSRPAPGREHKGCCSASDAADARFVAGMLGIPFYALNFERDFDSLIDYFADEYAAGRTPNPCVVCNDRLKFGRLVEYADAVGARYVATGHYARVAPAAGASCHDVALPGNERRNVLLRGVDHRKDQSYVLFGIGRDILDRLIFPIGGLTKPQVREIATRYGLPNRDKPDSVEICFVPDRDYARVVRQRRPEAFAAGDVLDTAGRVVGRHQGVANYTIGQRRGLGIAAGRPVYVTRLDVQTNTVTIGDDDELRETHLHAERVNYLCDRPAGAFRAAVKIRYLHPPAAATVHPLDDDTVRVSFDEPQRAITPGQAAVFYDGERVLGGGWIR